MLATKQNLIYYNSIAFTHPTFLSLPPYHAHKCTHTLSLNNVSLQDGQTLLHCASISGRTDMVKLLVDSGAQIDNKDKVSTELCIVLHCDSSLSISIFLLPLTLSHSPSLPLSPLSPVALTFVVASLF